MSAIEPTAARGEIVGSPDNFELFVRNWLAYGGRKASSQAKYRQHLRRYAAAEGVTERQAVAELLEGDRGQAVAAITEHMQLLVDIGLASNTMAVRWSTLISLIEHADRLGLIDWHLPRMRRPKTSAYRDTRGPTEDEFRALLDTAGRRGSPAARARNVAIFHLLGLRALRSFEILGLDVEHVDPPRERLFLIRKGQTDRVPVTIVAQSMTAIEAWLKHHDGRPALFYGLQAQGPAAERISHSGLWKMVRRTTLAAELDPRRVRPHGLRHTGITAALEESGGDLRAAAAFSGHADVRTLGHYDDARRDIAGQAARDVAARILRPTADDPPT